MRARTLRNAFRAAIPTALVLLLLSPAFASPIARRGLDESCENIKMVASTAGKAPGQRPGYVPVCADLPPGSERALPERQTGEPFRFVFNCTVSDTLCARAELGFESAGARIAKALNITSTVIVSATFRSFCGSQGSGSTSTCELKNTLGYATPSSIIQFTLPSTGQRWSIPQAVFKQLVPDPASVGIEVDAFDILADFNSDFDFWFPGDPTITQDQEDFEYTVMHELVHGLGFTARLTTFFDEVDPTIVTPAPLFYTTGGFAGWEPPALFTAYIFTKSQDNAAELCRTIASFQPPRGTTETDFYPLFKASGAPYLAARQLYQAATSGYGGMYVYIPKDAMPPANGTAAYLYTGTQWRTGSSISHLAQEYASRSTADFLMAPAIIPGETLDGIVARTSPGWAYGAMGPRTLDIMNINGYSINMNPGGVVIPTETAGPTRTATATATAASVSTTSKPNGAAPKVVGGSFAAFAIALLAALL